MPHFAPCYNIAMIRGKRCILGTLVFLMLVSAPTVALGATTLVTIVPDGCRGNGGCQKVCDIAQLAQNILNDGIYIAVFLSAVLFAWAGLKYLMNMGNSGEISKAKDIFVNVAIGLVIILGSWLVIDVVMRTLVGASVLPWNTIC